MVYFKIIRNFLFYLIFCCGHGVALNDIHSWKENIFSRLNVVASCNMDRGLQPLFVK